MAKFLNMSCLIAAHERKAKRLVKAFGVAAATLQMAQFNEDNVKAATAEYKRTRANLLTFMGV